MTDKTNHDDRELGPGEKALAENARELFARDLRDLDPAVARKLQAARRAAVEATEESGWRVGRHWLPAAATAAGVALLVFVIAPWKTGDANVEQLLALHAELSDAEQEIALADEGFDMLEALELLEWLDDNPDVEPG